MKSAECSSERRSAISAATANNNTTTTAYPASAVQATRLNRRVRTWLRRRSRTCARLHPVAHATHRLDRRGVTAEAQFFAQIVDIDVHDIGLGIELVIPHRLGDARARDGAAGVAHEEL